MPKLSKPEKVEVVVMFSQAGVSVAVNAIRVYGSEPAGVCTKDIFNIEAGRIREALKSKRRLYTKPAPAAGQEGVSDGRG